MKVVALDHIQIAMPPGEEASAREFYSGILGLKELPKPEPTAARGGVWFECGKIQLHLGVEAEFRPARKAHPALVIEGYCGTLTGGIIKLEDALSTAGDRR